MIETGNVIGVAVNGRGQAQLFLDTAHAGAEQDGEGRIGVEVGAADTVL